LREAVVARQEFLMPAAARVTIEPFFKRRSRHHALNQSCLPDPAVPPRQSPMPIWRLRIDHKGIP